MRLRDIYAEGQAKGKPVLSFEFFPPKSDKAELSLFEEAERLKRLGPSFFSMTYGAGGSTRAKTVELGSRLRERVGVETVCHLTCVGQSKDEVRGVLRQLREAGMENVMALRGDPPAGQADWTPHPEGYHHAIELVREARASGDFSVAVAGFPEVHPEATSREDDLRYLVEKIQAGADAVVTQLFFDNAEFIAFDKELKRRGVTIPIIPGIMPIVSAPQVRRIAGMCKARIPEDLGRELDRLGTDDEAARALGVEHAASQIKGLLDHGVAGVHLYCLNRAQSAEAILGKLGLAPT